MADKPDKAARTAITPTRAEDYAEWYQQVIRAADLAETSPVRGCMVIKPWGYAVWEAIQADLDERIKETGHVNAYFPLFIPVSFLEKEAAHVDGFAKECAVVTHHRLVQKMVDGKPKLVADPAAELEEPLVVRPTSETIIGEMFSRWVQSFRDLPLLINQWANVVRWEMRTRLFLRTAEFLWQEGHTAHATQGEAIEETMKMLDVYRDFAVETLALPVVRGKKTKSERFPGAVDTFCIEALMQDRKALQAGTSHDLGQNFARGSNIQFQGSDGKLAFAWTTSWGVSTRLIGALIMAHSDDDGLVLPPRVAPRHVVILPIVREDGNKERVLEAARALAARLKATTFAGRKVRVEVDARDLRGGDKTWEWIKKGVPLRVELGLREVESRTVSLTRRDRPHKERVALSQDDLVAQVEGLLGEIQGGLLSRARAFRDQNTQRFTDKAAFRAFFTPKNADAPEAHGGFAYAPWCGSEACEDENRQALAVTIRCLPLDEERREIEAIVGAQAEGAVCVTCGAPATVNALFDKAY